MRGGFWRAAQIELMLRKNGLSEREINALTREYSLTASAIEKAPIRKEAESGVLFNSGTHSRSLRDRLAALFARTRVGKVKKPYALASFIVRRIAATHHRKAGKPHPKGKPHKESRKKPSKTRRPKSKPDSGTRKPVRPKRRAGRNHLPDCPPECSIRHRKSTQEKAVKQAAKIQAAPKKKPSHRRRGHRRQSGASYPWKLG